MRRLPHVTWLRAFEAAARAPTAPLANKPDAHPKWEHVIEAAQALRTGKFDFYAAPAGQSYSAEIFDTLVENEEQYCHCRRCCRCASSSRSRECCRTDRSRGQGSLDPCSSGSNSSWPTQVCQANPIPRPRHNRARPTCRASRSRRAKTRRTNHRRSRTPHTCSRPQ